MITFPISRIRAFDVWAYSHHLRLGQAFHQFMALHKVTNEEDKLYCDQLYNADDYISYKMIFARADYEN